MQLQRVEQLLKSALTKNNVNLIFIVLIMYLKLNSRYASKVNQNQNQIKTYGMVYKMVIGHVYYIQLHMS